MIKSHCFANLIENCLYLIKNTVPGNLWGDVSFESLAAMKPLEAWDAVPDIVKSQALILTLCAEIACETQEGGHYTKGGPMPLLHGGRTDAALGIKFDLAKNWTPEMLKTFQNKELNNGRLAMLSIMSYFAAVSIPGSVPALTGADFL